MRRMSLDTTTVDSTRPTQRDPNVTPTEGTEGLSPAKVLCYLAPRLGHRLLGAGATDQKVGGSNPFGRAQLRQHKTAPDLRMRGLGAESVLSGCHRLRVARYGCPPQIRPKVSGLPGRVRRAETLLSRTAPLRHVRRVEGGRERRLALPAIAAAGLPAAVAPPVGAAQPTSVGSVVCM